MFNIRLYARDGRVNRGKIAGDILTGKITRDDLNTLLDTHEVRASFINNDFEVEDDKSQWTEEYRDRLLYMAVAETFNEEYLEHFMDVVEYINRQKKLIKRMKTIAALTVVFMLIYGMFRLVMPRSKNADTLVISAPAETAAAGTLRTETESDQPAHLGSMDVVNPVRDKTAEKEISGDAAGK